MYIQWATINHITVKGIFWLMECNLQVQNHLYICAEVKELLKGIPVPLKGIFRIDRRNKNLKSFIFKMCVKHTV